MRQSKEKMRKWESVLAVIAKEKKDFKSQRQLNFFRQNRSAIKDHGMCKTSVSLYAYQIQNVKVSPCPNTNKLKIMVCSKPAYQMQCVKVLYLY